MTHIDWKYYSEIDAPKQHLIRVPLENAEGLPAYCSEKLTWTEESWDTSDPRTFHIRGKKAIQHLYDHLKNKVDFYFDCAIETVEKTEKGYKVYSDDTTFEGTKMYHFRRPKRQ